MPPQEMDKEDCEMNKSGKLFEQRDVPLISVELENVTYSPVLSSSSTSSSSTSKKNRTTILNNISTTISPFQLSAWMGPSGSGKTSLISVAAGLTKPGDLSNDSIMKINGEEGRLPKRLVGVVWQDDLLLSNLSVEETIYFSARLKSPSTLSQQDVQRIVEETMQELGVLPIRTSLIGNTTVRGISGGERKRVAVASELVARPAVLLLDEPTSGLDSTTAQALMTTLKDLTMMGHSIAVVIHQPRTAIFNLLDHVLLLSQGHVVFDGKASSARTYLEDVPGLGILPHETGIADWIMDSIVNEEQRKDTTNKLVKYWKQHSSLTTECMELSGTGTNPGSQQQRRSTLRELNAIPKFESSFWTQLHLLTRRTIKQQRGERLTRVASLLTLAYILFTGLFWWRIPDDTSRIYQRNSLLFFLLIALSNGVVLASMTVFQQERALLERERAKKLYRVLPYFLAKTASDMTNNVLLPCINAGIVYWMSNLRPTAFFPFLLTFYLTLSTAQSMGLFFSIAIPNMSIALMIAPAITLFFMIMGGFYIPFDNMRPVLQWVSWLSFARYGYSAFIISEYEGRLIPCSDGVEVFSIGGGGDCPLAGEDVILAMGIDGIASHFWFNIGIIILLQLFFRTASYALLRRGK